VCDLSRPGGGAPWIDQGEGAGPPAATPATRSSAPPPSSGGSPGEALPCPVCRQADIDAWYAENNKHARLAIRPILKWCMASKLTGRFRLPQPVIRHSAGPGWPGADTSPALLLNRRGGRLSARRAHDILLAIAAETRLDPGFSGHVLRAPSAPGSSATATTSSWSPSPWDTPGPRPPAATACPPPATPRPP